MTSFTPNFNLEEFCKIFVHNAKTETEDRLQMCSKWAELPNSMLHAGTGTNSVCPGFEVKRIGFYGILNYSSAF